MAQITATRMSFDEDSRAASDLTGERERVVVILNVLVLLPDVEKARSRTIRSRE